MLIEELLYRQRENNIIAIKYGNNMITYADWHKRAMQISRTFLSIEIDNSVNFSLFLPNSINYAVAYFAVLYCKKIIVPIGIQAKEPEIVSILDYCEVDMIITDSAHLEFIQRVLKNHRYKIHVYDIDSDVLYSGDNNKEYIPKTSHSDQDEMEENVAIMLHTSGTTSNPKRVMLTHRNLISNVESNIQSLNLSQQDKVLIALPMLFGYCNTAQFLTHLYLGASIVILDSMFLPKQFFRIIEKEKITNFTGVPSMILMLLDYRYSSRYNFSSLRYICFGGGKMPIKKLKMLIEKFPDVGFVQTYGQTECSTRVTALLPEYALSKVGSVGTPIPNVFIRILDEEGIALPQNKIGEIVVQGKNTMKGYYKQPKITRQTICNGWIHTGDLGYIDDDGFLYLTGRIKNIIISGGINIYPEEIEQILLQYKNIDDVCVIGEEHDLMGELPVAKIVLKGVIQMEDLKRYCSDMLASYKVPVRFDIVDELPKTYNGKTKRY